MMKLSRSFFARIGIVILTSLTILAAGCSAKKTTNTSKALESEKTSSNNSSNSTTNSTVKGTKETETIKKSEKYNLKLELERFSMPGVFTMDKPKGWKVYKAGEYNTLAFLTRDEAEPLRQAFMFGEVGIFYVDAKQKGVEVNYQKNGGYTVPWIDMPVVSPFDGTTFLKNFDSILNSQIGKSFLGAANMPIPSGVQQIEVISEEKVTPLIPGMSTVLVRAMLVNSGKAAQGMFTLSTYKDAYGHGTAYLVAGVTAPVNEYISAQDILVSSIKSFKMEDSYVKAGINVINENGERFRQISQTISETTDIITKGWNERNKSFDVRLGKKGDQIMGVERVYDAASGEVYEVENGFYDYYKTHQEQYKQKELQPLPDTNYDLWGKAPIINHSLVLPK